MKHARRQDIEALFGLPVAGVGSSVACFPTFLDLGPPFGCVGHDR
jgi:hypothetical protein